MAAKRPSPARTPAITRDALVAAGLRVLERDGLDDLTMRKVAAELDVQAPSLYWHVRDKEELLDLLGEALSGGGLDLELPDADWREQVRVLAHRYRDHLKAHRDAVRVIGGRFLAGPQASAGMERALRIFRDAGFDPGQAAAAMYMVSVVFVQGFVLQETVPMRAVEATGGTPEDAMAVVAGELAALPEGDFPNVAAATPYLVTINLDERFAWGLELILDGLAMRLAAQA